KKTIEAKYGPRRSVCVPFSIGTSGRADETDDCALDCVFRREIKYMTSPQASLFFRRCSNSIDTKQTRSLSRQNRSSLRARAGPKPELLNLISESVCWCVKSLHHLGIVVNIVYTVSLYIACSSTQHT